MSTLRENQGAILVGILLIIFGGIFLLHNLGKTDMGRLIRDYWPLILVAVGAWHLISNNLRNPVPGIILIILGGIFMLGKWDLLEHNVWHYAWPLAIIALGLWLIFRPALRGGGGRVPAVKDDDLRISVAFGGLDRKVVSQKFRGGKASVVFGGIELDLTGAALDEGRATIDLSAVFGGIDVMVPREWKVVLDATPVLGGIEDKHWPLPDAEIKGTLSIKATAVFGGIEVKN